MVDSAETSTIMAILTMVVMTKRHLKIKRRALRKPQMLPATLKKVANKEKVLCLKFLQPLANKAAHKTMMMERKRKLKHQAKRSDLPHLMHQMRNKLKFE